jgi:asparagine synthase (glutamine-hydrolysing)
MCGITGLVRFDPQARKDNPPIDAKRIELMRDLLAHRGPDDAGTYLEDHAALAMRRLAIIDPAAGKQPIANETGDVVVVCNGEIYNFRQLRQGLENRGHRFSTGSDAEVIVHLYEERGDALLEQLRGMFALAVWDVRRKRLLLARDRIGIKPLYLAQRGGQVAFGSELKSVLASDLIPRRVDRQALHHALTLNYVPAPFSLIEGVSQLEPGEMAVADESGVRRSLYYRLRIDPSDEAGESEWVRRTKDKLAEAVSSHLVSDVPFGAFLSGGVDSSAVVALMSELLDDPVRTFAIDFAEPSYSEARYAKEVADRFGCQHLEFPAEQTLLPELLEALIWYADDPLADSSMLPVYLISKQAKKHVSMVLTGDGGDEVFAGYETYQAYFVAQLYRKLPKLVRTRIVKTLVEKLPVSLTKVSFDYKAKRFVAGAELPPDEAHFWWRTIFSEPQKAALYSREQREALSLTPTAALYETLYTGCDSSDPLARMLYGDTRFYLPADMLVKVDRMTMANGLEARVPFLDHELVELIGRAPSNLKLKGRRKKHLLKEALVDRLPSHILDRKKAGFNVPVNAWLAGDLKAFARDLLSRKRLDQHGFFDASHVQGLLDDHAAKRSDHSYRLFGLICFQLWYERFIATSSLSAPPLETNGAI